MRKASSKPAQRWRMHQPGKAWAVRRAPWRRAARGYSPRGTCAPARSSAAPPPWARVAWRSKASTKPSELTIKGRSDAEEGLCELPGIEWLQIIGLFAQANKFDGQAQLLLNGHHHAAFARAVEFGDNQA